jgi:hypothetical protein
MPRYHDGALGRRSRGVLFLRASGFVLAVALGVVAIWLIVTSTEQKRIEIGVLAGLWGLLLGAFAMFGVRRAHAAEPAQPGAELALRESAEIERAAELTARREHEERLERLLQQEVRHAITGELANLRAEIAALRNDLVENLSGQLHLEHTETTRIIGSDIEALQREVNQLKAARQRAELSAAPPAARAAAGPWVIDRPRAPAQPTRPVQPAQSVPPAQSVQPSQSVQQPAADAEPFAGLPRITPFTEFALDPIEPETQGRHGAHDSHGGVAGGEPPDQGRHAEPQHGDGDGGRRRRESPEGHDVLARILRRETATSG